MTMKIIRQGKISYLQAPWSESTKVVAGFTTRNGGCSRAPFNSLNLGFNSGDNPVQVETNRGTLARAFGLPANMLLTVNQVHGDEILIVNQPNPDMAHFLRVDADAIVTNQRGVMIGILVADCFPVLLYDPERSVAAAVHAGWRGAASGLIGYTVAAMRKQFGSQTHRIMAAIGPGIGAHKYEVDRPVRDAFREGSGQWERIATEIRLGHWQLDLQKSCILQLEAAGVPRQQIAAVSECTCCHKETFFSFRRDQGRTGRQIGFLLLS
jgi:YfiH family protein